MARAGAWLHAALYPLAAVAGVWVGTHPQQIDQMFPSSFGPEVSQVRGIGTYAGQAFGVVETRSDPR